MKLHFDINISQVMLMLKPRTLLRTSQLIQMFSPVLTQSPHWQQVGLPFINPHPQYTLVVVHFSWLFWSLEINGNIVILSKWQPLSRP